MYILNKVHTECVGGCIRGDVMTVDSRDMYLCMPMECRWYFYSGITDIFKYLKISLIHLQISVIQLRISVKELQISVIELRISVILLQISSIRHNYRYLKLY